MQKTDAGTQVTSEGWFVVNLEEAQAISVPPYGIAATFESQDVRFPHFGINVHVLQPGEPNCLYHSESAQEAFLVLSGECILVIEEQERRLRQWDFVHCPSGTAHVLVGAGDGPCAILMVGARRPDATVQYPVSEAAARHHLSTPVPSDNAREAYGNAGWNRDSVPTPMPWPR